MMVPMMVPQDAVTQIATGYPAAHQYQAAAAPCTTPFMPTTMTMTSSQQQHHHPHYFTNTTTPHPWMGGGVNMSSSASYHPHHTSTTSGGTGHQHHQQSFTHNMPSTSMPPSSQPHQYNYPAVGPSNFQPSGELHSMNTSTTASEATDNLAANNDSSQTQPHGMPNDGTGGEMNAFQGNIVGKTQAPPDATCSTTATTAIGLRHHPPPPHTGALTEASTIMTFHPSALTHVTPAVMSFGMQQQQQQQQHASHGVPSIATNNATTTMQHNSYAITPLHPATYYPSQGHDAISTVMMNHPYQHVHANGAAVAGAPNNNHASSSSFAVNDTSTSPLRQQQQQQQQPLVQHHQDESNKPLGQETTTTHQGGGGNLAHCA